MTANNADSPVDQIKLEAAYRMLNSAINYEKDGKSPSLINRALDRACDLEKEALGLKQ